MNRAGSFGEVFRGIWRGTEVAIKLMLEQDQTVENMQDFCNEISLLRLVFLPRNNQSCSLVFGYCCLFPF